MAACCHTVQRHWSEPAGVCARGSTAVLMQSVPMLVYPTGELSSHWGKMAHLGPVQCGIGLVPGRLVQEHPYLQGPQLGGGHCLCNPSRA